VQLLGFKDQLRKDQTRIFIKARKFFNEVHVLWKSKIVERARDKLKEEQMSNLQTGGICSTFELMDHLIKSMEKNDQHLLEDFIP